MRKSKELYENGGRRVSNIVRAVKETIDSVEGVFLQYIEVRDAVTLERIEIIEGPAVIALAAIVGKARLIDNIVVGR